MCSTALDEKSSTPQCDLPAGSSNSPALLHAPEHALGYSSNRPWKYVTACLRCISALDERGLNTAIASMPFPTSSSKTTPALLHAPEPNMHLATVVEIDVKLPLCHAKKRRRKRNPNRYHKFAPWSDLAIRTPISLIMEWADLAFAQPIPPRYSMSVLLLYRIHLLLPVADVAVPGGFV